MHRHPVAALLLACVLLLLVVFAPLPAATVGLRLLHDFAHAPIFGCIALLFLYAVRSSPRFDALVWKRQYALAFAAALLFGALTELAQIPAGRDSSWLDVRSDLLGAAGFLALYRVFDPSAVGRRARIVAMVVGVALLTFHSLPVARAALAYERRAETFPVLADFTRQLDLYFVQPQHARVAQGAMPRQLAKAAGEHALRVGFGSGPYPGLNFYEPAPDWRGYRALALDVGNPGEQPLTLTLRVHDVSHTFEFLDRFNRSFDLPARTRRVIRIPLAEIEAAPRTRSMDLRRIAGVILFRADGSAAPEMDVSKLWLE